MSMNKLRNWSIVGVV